MVVLLEQCSDRQSLKELGDKKERKTNKQKKTTSKQDPMTVVFIRSSCFGLVVCVSKSRRIVKLVCNIKKRGY